MRGIWWNEAQPKTYCKTPNTLILEPYFAHSLPFTAQRFPEESPERRRVLARRLPAAASTRAATIVWNRVIGSFPSWSPWDLRTKPLVI